MLFNRDFYTLGCYWGRFRTVVAALLIFGLLPAPAVAVHAKVSKKERVAFQQSIRDRRYRLHRRYIKAPREQTKYIIVHTSEAGLGSTLNVVSEGKIFQRQGRTYGGHAHYVIARNGLTYRTLDKHYRADHAGLSMWNGETDISDVSIGIELVGYHYTPITEKQYRSVGILIDILKDVYHLDDQAVLTHSQIAYGKPNRWVKRTHRGRKKCAKNFERHEARLGPTWSYDPDVRAGRLTADRKLNAIYYRRRVDVASRIDSNMITAANTAWSIAGEDFDSSTTLYRLPGGRVIAGDEIGSRIGWDQIPANTVVLLNQEKNPNIGSNEGPIKTIANGLTAWSFAGTAYKSPSTFYFFPNGNMKNGSEISDWDDFPSNTKLIVGYRSPVKITATSLPLRIAGERYNDRETLYYFPNRSLLRGDRIKNFKDLPSGVLVFIPLKQS
ncbi:MAG TPA: N-acetylmuramoyl-L-alanine amidase [Deltaproteobacteria bacterium]|nr:N-acetylmuramoyl-L-alanine amidase [Deltaproteobacteria bacterium]